MNFTKNEVTGKMQTQFTATLVSISEQVLQNINGTPYRVATIDFLDKNGKEQRVSALVYEKNYSYGMEVGNKYLATATYDEEQGVLITVSHLAGGGVRANAEMFGFNQIKEITPEDVRVQ